MNKYLYILITVLILTSWFGSSVAWGAITFNASSSFQPSAASTTHKWSHTIGSDSNMILIVGLAIRGNVTSTAVSVSGQQMTRIIDNASGVLSDAPRTYLWYLLNPPTGVQNISSTVTGACAQCGFGAVSFSGVSDIGHSTGTAITGVSSGTIYSVDLTTNLGDLVVDVTEEVLPTSTLPIASSTQTVYFGVNGTTNQNTGGSYKNASQGTTRTSWTAQGSVGGGFHVALSAVVLKQFIATSTTPNISTSQTAGSMSITSGSYTIQ